VRLRRPLLLASSLVDAYLLTLLAAAAAARRHVERPRSGGELRFAILVPAHDEEQTLGPTLRSLLALDYPRDRYEVVVVADNCTDATAEVARAAGATVLERHDRDRRGKGHALAWAIPQLDADAVAIVDADCDVAPGLLRAFEARFAAGASVVQARYRVGNPDESETAALRFAAFALMNTVRPLGKSALGLSSGLFGTGMAFRADVLRRVPWRSFSLLEDVEQHFRVIAAGERVVFAPEATVDSAMPTTTAGARDQQLRWEGGKLQLVREWTPRLLADGIAHRDPVRVHAALEPLVPPQSLLLVAHLAGAAVAAPSRDLRRHALANLAAQATFVLGGLALAEAPPSVWRALLSAPKLVASKLGIYATLARRGSPREWVRTARE
jgi:hypothetical protein